MTTAIKADDGQDVEAALGAVSPPEKMGRAYRVSGEEAALHYVAAVRDAVEERLRQSMPREKPMAHHNEPVRHRLRQKTSR